MEKTTKVLETLEVSHFRNFVSLAAIRCCSY